MFTFQHVEARVDHSKPLLLFRTSGKDYHSQVNSRKEEYKNMLKQYTQDKQRIIDLSSGVYSSVYSYIHIYEKTAIFSRFYKKLGPFYNKLRFFAQKRPNLARNWHF